ncbi:MAG: TlpA family protein disulfide reductase [Sulfuriflexus sp.]|nr:TlpA family protein disulfide reductase [Sulfuriflexus sp.]
MKIKDTFITVIAVAILGLLGYVWFSPAGIGTAPELKFITLDNKPLTLQSLKGKPVLITFWATSCTGCIKEIPHLVELHNKLAKKGLTIIGVSMAYDPPNHVTEFVNRRKLPYRIAMDIDGSASRAFGGIKLTPTTFLISPDGRIVLKKIGDLDMASLTTRIETMLKPQQAAL